jgi:hypothetical protein
MLSEDGRYDVKIKILALEEMLTLVSDSASTTVESSELSRFIQLIKAAGFRFTK